MRPILLLSLNNESSTDSIVEWLDYLGKDFKRLNLDTSIDGLSIKLDNDSNEACNSMSLANIEYPLHEVLNIWYRKGHFNIAPFFEEKFIPLTLRETINKEWEQLRTYLSSSISIGSPVEEYGNNKLLNLTTAKKVGLKIPSTLITTKKADLISFMNQHEKVITKPIHHGHKSFETKDFIHSSEGTRLLKKADLEIFSDTFCPSLFQGYVEKYLELRIFFIEEKLFPMAIFSQNDDQTKVDFRNYNHERPNRNVPFRLPREVESQLIEFNRIGGFSTGSLDLILTPEYDYYFLEINPSGQFGWVSAECNYYLEKYIAERLCQ